MFILQRCKRAIQQQNMSTTTIVINPDEDYYGAVNEEEAAMFLDNVRKTETVVNAAKKERGAKEGELVVRATMEHFWAKDGMRNIASIAPAKPESRDKRDGSGKYNAGLPLQATIEEFDHYIPGLCEKRKDGQPGWHVRWTMQYFEKSNDFLLNKDKTPTARTLAAWQVHPIPDDDVQAYGLKEAAIQHGLTEEGLSNDPLSVRIRQCVGRDGKRIDEMWTNVSRGESVRFKAPDHTPKDNLLRSKTPSGAFAVQQSTPLIFNHVVPTIYVTFDDGATSQQHQQSVSSTGVPALPPTGAIGASAGPAAGAKKKEASLGMIFCYECKGSVLLRDNKEAADLCASERMHFMRSKDTHQLVPIHLVRAGTKEVAKSVYFFVPPRYITRWNPEHPEFWPKGSQGISLFRNTLQLSDLKSNPSQQGDVNYYFAVDLAVFQWQDRANTKERYVVNARVRRDNDTIWRQWGITDGDAYAAIMLANQDIPFHAILNFWKKATMERPANDPKEMNRVEGTENIRGYYDFIVDQIVPDYLRYFRNRGMRVSRDFVGREFENWGTIFAKTKTTMISLQTYDKPHARENPLALENPLHALQGLSSAVVSLGNGQPPPALGAGWPELSIKEGYYHGCKGDITPLLAPGERYHFYVLTSRPLLEEERAKYCGPNASEKVADDWLMQQIERAATSQSPFYYWLFAVDTQAKMAKSPQETIKATPPSPAPTTTAISSSAGTKREREEENTATEPVKIAHIGDEEEEGEEVYE